ncbi:MAG: hypothetical protein HY790_08700 [Deltaproteobacteria bacterium]|nr:hypothetical protein [Deltaproteobacteria bacterium]MBI4795898.1 hypothetical protein [Deltaproteobacteria bacterium]
MRPVVDFEGDHPSFTPLKNAAIFAATHLAALKSALFLNKKQLPPLFVYRERLLTVINPTPPFFIGGNSIITQ